LSFAGLDELLSGGDGGADLGAEGAWRARRSRSARVQLCV